MIKVIRFICLCSAGVAISGCSCAKDRPSPVNRHVDESRAASSDSESDNSDSRAEQTDQTELPPNELPPPVESGSEAGEPESPEDHDPISGKTHSPPDADVIRPPAERAGSRPPDRDAESLAAEVRQSLRTAERHAQRQAFGDACRELLTAYEKLNDPIDESNATLSGLKASVAEKLAQYGDQANSAAGAQGAGGDFGKPLMVQ